MKRDRFVYFIRPVGQEGPVKIGCSAAPQRRVEDLAVWSPYPLEVAAASPGSLKIERQLHNIFRADHSHREWFRASPKLSALIEAVAGGATVAEAIDLSDAPDGILGRRWTEEHSKRRSYHTMLYFADVKNGGNRPRDIELIMDRWSESRGHPYRYPSDEEFQRLDSYIEASRSAPNLARAA